MIPLTQQIADVAGVNGAQAGHWFQVWPVDERTHHIISSVLSVGTGTWNIEGRNSPDDSPTVIDTLSASAGKLYAKFKQIRVNITAAAGLSLLVTVDKPARDAGA